MNTYYANSIHTNLFIFQSKNLENDGIIGDLMTYYFVKFILSIRKISNPIINQDFIKYKNLEILLNRKWNHFIPTTVYYSIIIELICHFIIFNTHIYIFQFLSTFHSVTMDNYNKNF